MRDKMAGAFEQLQREVGRENAEGEAFADQAIDPVLVIQRIGDGCHSARTMTKQIERKIGMPGTPDLDRP